MTGSDEEFENFLKRRKPVFRASDDMFEPPAELDRVVLRQAREAIEVEPPLRVFRGPRWAAPIALAATLVLAIGVVFQAGMPSKRKPAAEVTVQNVAQRMEMQEEEAPAPVAPAESTNQSAREDAAANDAANDTVTVDLTQPMLASRARAPAPGIGGGRVTGAMDAPPLVVTVPAAKATERPAWRRDSNTWLAEIERLRNSGDTTRANAELEEYKRQHRAYAVAPDQ